MNAWLIGILLASCVVTVAADGGSFVKSQTLVLGIHGETTGLQVTSDGRHAVVHGDATKYWLLSGAGDKPMALSTLTSDRTGYRPPVAPITNPFALKGKPIVDDSISQAQWTSDRLVLFADNNTYFLDPVRKVITHSYPVLKAGHDSKKHWSAVHQRLIHGSELLDTRGKPIQREEDHRQAFHGHQSGLLVTSDEHQYITAGFHTQDVKIWSLPEGRLLKKFHLGGLFTTRKVTDIALFREHLLVASAIGYIEVRSRDDVEVKWSIRPCDESARFVSVSQTPSEIFFRCGAEFGSIQFNNGRWSSRQLKRGEGAPMLESVAEITALKKAVLGFRNGKVVSYDMVTGNVDQVLMPGETGTVVAPAHVAYLKETRQLLVVEQPNRLHVFTVRQ